MINMVTIYTVNIATPLTETVYESYLQKIPQDKQQRIRAFLRREDAVRALVGQVLLHSIIIDSLGIPGKALAFEQNAYGKPALMNNQDFHFNLSHAGDWVVLALDQHPVGIDVERIKDMDLDVAKRFFSAREYSDLMAQPETERIDYFFDLWTLKESYIKAIGKGLSQPLDSFAMIFEEAGISIIKEDKQQWFFRQYPLAPGYKLSVCAALDDFPGEILNKTQTELYNDFIRLRDRW